jgi:hypothetical protein
MKTKVYLDTNVLINIEEGTSDFNSFMRNKEVDYYFSSAHLEELIDGVIQEIVDAETRLQLLDCLCRDHCLLTGVTELPTFESIYPKVQYNQIIKSPQICKFRNKLIQAATNFNPDSQKFLEVFKKDAKYISGIPPEDIFRVLDELFSKAERPVDRITIAGYLSDTHALGRSIYGSLFNLLDASCYHKDRKNDRSNIGRIYDASHAYFAQLCDVLVSNDKRMRYKAAAVYHYLGVKTKIMTEEEFKNSYEI